MKQLALTYGVLAYLLFLGTFVYAIGFVGNVGVPKSIDSGPTSSPVVAALIDALLLGTFAVQHSVMARHGFKRQWTRIVSWHVERSTYVVAASLALGLVLWQWRPIPRVIWDLRGTQAGSLLAVLFWVGWGILLFSAFLISHFERFGLQQVWAYFRGREWHRPPFQTPPPISVGAASDLPWVSHRVLVGAGDDRGASIILNCHYWVFASWDLFRGARPDCGVRRRIPGILSACSDADSFLQAMGKASAANPEPRRIDCHRCGEKEKAAITRGSIRTAILAALRSFLGGQGARVLARF